VGEPAMTKQRTFGPPAHSPGKAMLKRVLVSMVTMLAAAIAVVSCQRPIEGAACPCLAGYQCCQAEQACYPEGVRCPSALPGDLIWTATGVPTFDQAGNVYVDDQQSTELHAISLLDKESGEPRWTQRGWLELRCSTEDATVLMQWSDLARDPGPRFQLLGVSNADGTERWALPMNASGHTLCAGAGKRIFAVQPAALASVTPAGEISSRGSVATSDEQLIWLMDVEDDLAVVTWQAGAGSEVAALELPGRSPGSVRWEKTMLTANVWMQGQGKLFTLNVDAMTGNRSLVRLSPTDGGPVWTYDVGRSAVFPGVYVSDPERPYTSRITSPWPGIVVLRAESDLIGVGVDSGDLLWTLPAAEDGYEMLPSQATPSGDLLISYRAFSGSSAMYKLAGADGSLHWTIGPLDGSVFPTDDESYVVEAGFVSRVDRATGVRVWTSDDGSYSREVVGYDDQHVFVRMTADTHDVCQFCPGRLVALARSDGRYSWQTDVLFEETYHRFFRFQVAGPRIYVFARTPDVLNTGTLWAFWR